MIEETCGACLMARHFDCFSDRCRCCGDAPDDPVEALRAATVDRWISYVDRNIEAVVRVAALAVAAVALAAVWRLWP